MRFNATNATECDKNHRLGRAPHWQIATIGLGLAGIAVCLVMGTGRGTGVVRWVLIGAAGLLAVIPPITRTIASLLDQIREPSPGRRAHMAVTIGVLAAGYFVLTAFNQDRDFFPKTHDDCSYAIGMQMAARGRLWMPAHPLADFFDTFYVLVRPVYASQYFPGTAMLYAPAVWLHWPTWVMPVLSAGAVVGLMYRVVTDLVDGVAGALAALWITSLSWFRMLSILLMSQVPELLFGLLMVWAWLRWRSSRRAGWLLLIGAAAGWAAITRPVDALCFALPIGVAIAMNLWRQPGRYWLAAAALILVAATPFLVVQLVFDKGVTGHWLETPFKFYLDRNAPGSGFGFHPFDPSLRAESSPPQKQDYYQQWVVPFIQRHQPGTVVRAWAGRYLPMILDVTMPARLLLPLAMVGLLGLANRKRWVLGATLPLFVALYFFYTIFLEHYAIALVPAIALLAVLGIGALARAWPRFAEQIRAAGVAVIVISCITSLWEVNRWITPSKHPDQRVSDETFRSPVLRAINEDYPASPDFHKPAVVLFRYHPGDNYFEEPVYNWDVAWPDDAAIVRAHDLGPQRDREIVKYYAARQPQRAFYLFDAKSSDPMKYLGTGSDPASVLTKLNDSH